MQLLPSLAVEPDGDRLFKRLARHIDDALLDDIAACDYGMELEQNRRELRLIRDTGLIKAPMPWPPLEVLNLTRWSEPVTPQTPRGFADTRGHRKRAFCCAVLLRAYGDEPTRRKESGYNSTLVQLLDGLPHIVLDVSVEVLALLTWLLPRMHDASERAFIGIALIDVLLASGTKVADDDLAAFAAWIMAEETRALGVFGPVGDHRQHWLLRTTHYTLRCEKWIAAGERIAASMPAGRTTGRQRSPVPAPAGFEAARAIGRRLMTGKP